MAEPKVQSRLRTTDFRETTETDGILLRESNRRNVFYIFGLMSDLRIKFGLYV